MGFTQLRYFFCCVLLASCAPRISTVYHAPKVEGKVISALNLQPVRGIEVQHKERNSLRVETDINGDFILPSVTSNSPTTLAAGDGLKHYYLRLGEGLESSDVVITASMQMPEEEQTNLITFVAPYSLQFVSGEELTDLNQATFDSEESAQGQLQICNQSKVQNALHTLLIARTVLKATDNPPPPFVFDSKLAPDYRDAVYLQTLWQWQDLYVSCDGTLDERREARLLIDKVEQEAQRYIMQH